MARRWAERRGCPGIVQHPETVRFNQQTEPVLSRETIRWGFVFNPGGDLKAHGRLPAVDAAHGQYLAVHAAGHLRGQK